MRRFQGVPLRVVLVVPFVLEIIVAVGLIGYFSFRSGQQAVSNIASQLMSEVSDRIERELSHYLDVPAQITQNSAAAIQFGKMDWRDSASLEHYFWQQLKIHDGIDNQVNAIAIADERKNFLEVNKVSDRTWFTKIRDKSTNFQLHNYLAAHPGDHNILMDNDSSISNNTTPLDPWYLETKETGKPIWRLAASRSTPDEPILMAVNFRPFYDRNNTFQGVIGSSVNLSNLCDLLSRSKIGQRGQAYVVERNGLLIATSTGEPPLQQDIQASPEDGSANFNPDQWRLNVAKSSNLLTRYSARELMDTLGSFQRINSAQQFSVAIRNQRYFVRVAPLRTNQDLDWLTVVVIPESDFMGEINHDHHAMILLCIGALLGAIALGLLTADWIAKPILRLSRASRDLALGNLEEAVDESTCIAELKVLGHSFNQMTEHLQLSFDQVKTALQESKEKFTKIFRTSPDPIVISTLAEGQYLEVNESFLKLSGLSREEVIGHTAFELGIWASPEERQRFTQALQEMGNIQGLELTLCNQFGNYITVLVSCEVIELDGRQCILAISKDISDYKQAEEKLRRSEANLREAQQVAHIGSWEYDIATRKPSWSEELFQIVGRDPGEPEPSFSETLEQIVHPDDRGTFRQLIEQAISEGKPFRVDLRVFRSDGSLRYIENRGKPIFNQAGQVVRLVGTTLDITSRKQAEESMRQSEMCFRAAFDRAAIGMSIVSPEGQFLEVNTSLCQMLGYAESELLGMRFHDITHPADLNENVNHLHKLLAGEISHYQTEKRYFHKDGQTVWILLSTSLVRDSQQQPLYFVSQMQNITPYKYAETVLHQDRDFNPVIRQP
ncbi:MAG: PAS domain S-box protein [Leptolyngbyaceae cyanobacterium RU_5_1]|nr:PAS domain S-box protein [Leptolyngbyaceae cyanobacterium RU_5_1]